MKKKVTRKQNNAKFCIVCGVDNDLGLHCEFYELEDKTIVAICTPQSHHQSYPGRVHGGIITSLLDETMGRAISIEEPETWAVTAQIEVRFKKPVPYDEEIIITGRVTDNNRRIFSGEGQIILQNGDIAATASGRYMKQKLASITDFEANGDSFVLYPSDSDPKEIDIPG